MESGIIRIRTFSPQGSSVREAAVEEAERIVAEARRRRALVVDEDQEMPIGQISPETRNIMIVDPIQGG